MFRKSAPPPVLDDGDQPSPHRAKIGKRVSAKLGRNPMISRINSGKIALFVRRDFLNAEECASMRGMIDTGAQPSTLFSGTQGAEYRTSHSCHMDRHDSLVRDISVRIAAMMGIEAELGETIQGQRYTTAQEYKPHWDYFPVNDTYWPYMREQGGQRCWTAMIYLSNVAEGGETHFPYAGFMIPPREGTIIIWNNLLENGAPNRDTLHAALPVKTGIKYVATQWFRERAWVAKDE